MTYIPTFSAQYPFRLDEFQLQAMRAIEGGRSALVSAPTGTGKTVIAEFAVEWAFAQGRRAVYTAPIKALSNQTFRILRSRHQGAAGLMTGDVVENPDGRVLVMTTEVLRNILLESPADLHDVACIVFDEVHYLADPERGTAWEESIILAPREVPLVCLSATVANADEIAAWLERVHGPTELILHEERAVPLEHRFFFDGELRLALTSEGRRARKFPNVGGERLQPGRKPRAEVRPWEIVQALLTEDLLPAIYFLFSRRAVEEAAESCAVAVGRRLGRAEDQGPIQQALQRCLDTLDPADRNLAQIRRLTGTLSRGIGFHHAGMLPMLKVLVEELFAAGHLRAVFATDTLALGINAPARSVVVGEMTKYDGEMHRLLTSNEYRQLTGRAGRRGMDERGTAVFLYSPWVPAVELLEVASGPLLPMESAFRLGYNAFLNLWRGPRDEARVAGLVSDSLMWYQADEKIRRLERARQETARRLAKYEANCPACGQPYAGREHGRPCPEGRKHGRAARERARLARDQERESAQLQQLTETRDHAARDWVRAVRRVLERFGYLERGRPTARAPLLRAIFDSNALLISELVQRGRLQDLAPAELAEVCSWFASDKERAPRSLALTPRLHVVQEILAKLEREVAEVERHWDVPLSGPLGNGPFGVALAWASQWTLQNLMERSGLAEGDLLQLLQKTIDLLGQLRDALVHSGQADTPFATRLAVAQDLLRHGVVEQYYQMVLRAERYVPEDGRPTTDDRRPTTEETSIVDGLSSV